jgi:DNA-binding MarR family transcriptional regulator
MQADKVTPAELQQAKALLLRQLILRESSEDAVAGGLLGRAQIDPGGASLLRHHCRGDPRRVSEVDSTHRLRAGRSRTRAELVRTAQRLVAAVHLKNVGHALRVDYVPAECILEKGMKAKTELPPLTPVVFNILLALWRCERHGYGIMQEVRRESEGRVVLRPGTLYRALSRLLESGLVEESDLRPDPELDDERRRYYRLPHSVNAR